MPNNGVPSAQDNSNLRNIWLYSGGTAMKRARGYTMDLRALFVYLCQDKDDMIDLTQYITVLDLTSLHYKTI